MHSARTARLGRLIKSQRSILLTLSAIIALGALLGCAEGNADDARRGEERARSRTSVVAGLQSTRAAERFRTPQASTVEPIVDVEVATLAIAVELRANNAPARELTEVPGDAEAIYATALVRNLRSGQVISAIWSNADGTQIAISNLTVRSDGDEGWVALPLTLEGERQPGEYGVTILIDGKSMSSMPFHITP